MCGGPEHFNPRVVYDSRAAGFDEENGVIASEKQDSVVKEMAESCSPALLELAANNDLVGFKQALEEGGSSVNERSLWYGRQIGFDQKMVLEQRTPLMVAALYGSLDVLSYILSEGRVDVNEACGSDMSTALHCAAAGGSILAIETVGVLIKAGADVNFKNAHGRKPADVIMVSPKLGRVKNLLENLLIMGSNSPMKIPWRVSGSGFYLSEGGGCLFDEHGCAVSVPTSSPLFSSPEATSPAAVNSPLSSPPKSLDISKNCCDCSQKKEFAVDSSLPDIKNSIYSTDEFRMYSFKVRPCSRAYSHDWTECPFVHPGENARRRDPRKYHYSCVPCPDFRKGACRRGDVCEYAHGVFECWLHPAQYRTRLCKDGTNCCRRVCFFAHTPEELRPLYPPTGSSMLSQRTTMTTLDKMAVMNPLAPGSASSVLMMSSSNPSQSSFPNSPMSPLSSANTSCHSSFGGGSWAHPNLPTLHLTNGVLQASRLRTAVNARHMHPECSTESGDYEGQLLNEFACLSTQARGNGPTAIVSSGGMTPCRPRKFKTHNVAPTNLEDLFASEVFSPKMTVSESAFPSQIQSHKAAQLSPQLQSQMLSSFNTQVYPQGSTQVQMHMQHGGVDCQSPSVFLSPPPVEPASYNLSSLGPLSSLTGELERQNSNGSPLSPVMSAAADSRAVAFSQRDRGSSRSGDLGGSTTWSEWGSPNGKVNWGIQGEELRKFRKSASFGIRSSDEPDLSWVQTLFKEAPMESMEGCTMARSVDIANNVQMEATDLGAWISQINPDQIAPLTL